MSQEEWTEFIQLQDLFTADKDIAVSRNAWSDAVSSNFKPVEDLDCNENALLLELLERIQLALQDAPYAECIYFNLYIAKSVAHVGKLLKAIRCQIGRDTGFIIMRANEYLTANKRINVLSPEELARLLRVPTSNEAAQQIHRRNLPLLICVEFWLLHLHELETLKNIRYQGKVGCPHCSDTYPCESCAWQKINKTGNPIHYCCTIPFGGVRYSDLMQLKTVKFSYTATREFLRLQPGKWYHGIVKTELSMLRRYFLGHLDWAEAVMARHKPELSGQGQKKEEL